MEQILHADLDQESEENLKMAAIVKAEREEAHINLVMTLRVLDRLTEENLLAVLMGRAEMQWNEALDKHVAFCTKLGEDPYEGAHMEWLSAIMKLFYDSYYEVEMKLEAIRVANEYPGDSDNMEMGDANPMQVLVEKL